MRFNLAINACLTLFEFVVHEMMFRSFLAPPRPARASPKKISPLRKSTLGPAGDKSKGDPYNFDEILSMSESSQEK